MKKIFNYVLAISAIVIGMAFGSCNEEEFPSPSHPDGDVVPVILSVEVADLVSSRAIDENLISDINIYFFGNKISYHFYYAETAPSFTFQMLPGTYQLYVVTNVHQDLGELTKDELLACDYIIGDMVSDIPMTGNMNIHITNAMTLPTLQVKRVAAKISYNITVDNAVASNIKLRSVQFCKLPKSTVLFGSGTTSDDVNDFYDANAIEIDNDMIFSDVFYMFENCQGNVNSIYNQTDKSPEKAPKCASYMRILADGPGKLLEYIVYLGENSTTNFDVRRNTKHEMNLYIKGENEIDNRVTVYEGLYYGKANCYICTGSQVAFDVTPYRTSKNLTYTYSDIYAGVEYEAVRAALLWQDTKNLVRSVSINDNTVIVNTNGGKGNAVVAIYNKAGEILWSFHIWCTDQPEICEFAKNSVGNSYSVMDRNLGATTSALGVQSSYGLYYQWGRKDPFVGALGATSSENGKMYDINGGEVSFQQERAVAGLTVENAIRNPQVYYTGYNTFWVAKSESTKLLWGDNIDDNVAPVKTVYDPCPAGYKVAPQDLLRITSKNGSLTTTQPSGYYTYGQFNSGWALYYDGRGTDRTKIFYLQAGGSRAGLTGGISMGTITGAMWTSGCNSNFSASSAGCNSVEILNQSIENLSHGFNIRCVKE